MILSSSELTSRNTIYRSDKSIVYRVTVDEKNLIAKCISNDHPSSFELASFTYEQELLKRFNSPFIIKFIDFVKVENSYALITEDGGIPLSTYIKNAYAPVSLQLFFRIARQITNALHLIHKENIIHKDINPSNIVIDCKNYDVKIIDFGIASELSQERQEYYNANRLEGSLPYISPEQTGRMNRDLDYRTDFYSLGVTFFELLTGKRPFDAKSILGWTHAHLAQKPVQVYDIQSHIPPILGEIIEKLLQKNPDERYQSCVGLLHDLKICEEEFNTTGSISPFALASKDINEKFHIPQELTGRDKELDILLSGYKKMLHGTSQLLLVSGYSGIGKTSLVREVQKPLVKEKGFFICGKFEQYEKAKPYSAITEAMETLVNSLLKESEETLQVWKQSILKAVKDNGQILLDLIPNLKAIIGEQPRIQKIAPQQALSRFTYTFKQFFSLFTQEKHPLVLFLDDLQWADYSSIKLIEELLLDDDFSHLYIIGSFRNNEVTEDHLFHLMVSRVSEFRAVETLHLKELSYKSVQEIICKTTNSAPNKISELCSELYAKSGGNPFFLNELLKEIFFNGGFSLSITGEWEYDPKALKDLEISDNVIDLMISRFKKLPIEVEKSLTVGAALGSSFDLFTLSIVRGIDPLTLFSHLKQAIQEGLLLPEDNNFRYLQFNRSLSQLEEKVHLSFLHDKIQQAAYTLLPKDNLPLLHNRIAKTLIDILDSDKISEKVIEIVGHYNKSMEIISTPMEKITLCRLNLMAGRRAHEATAYEAALEFFKIAEYLLPENNWTHEKQLSIELYQSLAENSYINTNLEEGDRYSAIVLEHSNEPLIQAETLFRQIPFIFSIGGKLKESIEIGQRALLILDEKLPLDPSHNYVETEYNVLNRHLSHGDISDLKQLPKLNNKKVEKIIQILIEINAPAYFLGNEYLFRLIMLRLVNLSIENGNSLETAFAYSNFATSCSGYYHEYKRSLQFGKLALSLNAQQPNNKYSSKILFTYTAYVHLWNHPINQCMELYEQSYQQGLLTGEINYANFALARLVYDYAFSSLEEACSVSEATFQKLKKNRGYLSLLCAYRSSMHYFNFSGKTSSRDSLSFGEFKENNCVEYWKNKNDLSGITGYYLTKIVVLYNYENNYSMHHFLSILDKNITSLTGLYHNVTYTFYSFLVITDEKKRIQKIEKMRRWCSHNDENFRHFLLIMEAEIFKYRNETYPAIEKYEEAISFANKKEFVEYRALAKRLLAKLYIEKKKDDLAKFYMSEAFYDYSIWGASRICEFLMEKYGAFIINLSGENRFALYQTIQNNSTTQANEIIDLNAIIKASRMLSGEVSLNKLIDKYVHLIQENAGAERVVLLLRKQDEWYIEGEIRTNKIALVQKEIPLNNYKDLPQTLFTFVERTRQTIILNNATTEGNFTEDPYIKQYGPNSILMLPITNLERLTGILFVENRVSPNLFTTKRVEILKLLSAQVAISIENAQLYNTLERKVELRTAQLTETNKNLEIARREADKANKAKSDFLANMSHEIRTPMNSILGFSEIMLEKEAIEQNRHYLQSIHSSGTALLAIINDILDLSKVEAGKMKLEYTPFSLESLFNELATLFSQKTKNKKISLTLNVNKELPKAILLDEIRLRQILINLIGNAIKFTHKGSVKVNAEIDTKEDIFKSTFDLLITVEDTGIGIERDQLEAIFEAFVQAESQKEKEYGGTGLGLVITKRLVEMMNGEISVKSQPQKGSTFTVLFKEVEVASANEVVSSFEETIELNSICFKPARILVADDVNYNRELLKRFLSDFKFTFTEATDGNHVMDSLEDDLPDLLLLDIKMPNKNGIEVLKQIRATEKFKNLPVVVITASVMRESEEIVRSLSDSYLRKPVGKKELIQEIMKYVPFETSTPKTTELITQNYLIPHTEKLLEFQKLANGGFLDEIFELSLALEEENSAYGPFCKQLQQLSRSFLEHEIIDLLNQYMGPQNEYS